MECLCSHPSLGVLLLSSYISQGVNGKLKRNGALDFAHVCVYTVDVDTCTRLPQKITQIYKQIELIIGKFTASFNNLRRKFISSARMREMSSCCCLFKISHLMQQSEKWKLLNILQLRRTYCQSNGRFYLIYCNFMQYFHVSHQGGCRIRISGKFAVMQFEKVTTYWIKSVSFY